MHPLEQLKQRMAEIAALNEAAAVLSWDHQTYMPPGGAPGRAEQLSVLAKISHEMQTSAETGSLLAGAEKAVASADPDSDDAAYVRVARRDYDHAVKIPRRSSPR